MAKSTVGHVTSIAINSHKVSLQVKPINPDANTVRLVLFDDPKGTHTIPPVELTHRSWMVALAQTSLTQKQMVIVTHDGDDITQIELGNIELEFNLGKDNDKDEGGKPRPPRPDRPDRPDPRPPGG